MRPIEKTPDTVTGGRIAAVDYAKTLAIACVVVIHVSSEVLLAGRPGALRGWKVCFGAVLPEALFRCF